MNNIREYREKKEMTRVQLAKYVGCSERHIQRIEKNECHVSLHLAFKIAYYLTGGHDVRIIWKFWA